MSFDALITKVTQAEQALESRERQTVAQWDKLKTTWRQSWTPGRIVVAGLISGFMVGRAKPLRVTSGGGVLNLASALAGLFAGGSAQVAAEEAEQAAASAAQAANPASTASTAASEIHGP